MKKIRRILTIVLVVTIIGGGIYAYTSYRSQQNMEAMFADLQTVTIGRGPLVATIGATGVVRANQTAVLTWQTTGRVEDVNVKAGDLVPAEGIMATLSQTSLPQGVILAGAELVGAQKALDALMEPATELALAQAVQAINTAQEGVDLAQRRYDNLFGEPSQTVIDTAQARVTIAAQKLRKAEEAYAPYANKPETNVTRAMLLSMLAQAQAEYDAAVRYLNNLLGDPSEQDIAMAAADLEVAAAQLAAAEDFYQTLQDGPDADDIAAAKARVAAATATLDMSALSAPFKGTVTEVNNKPGDQIGPGMTAFRIDDLSRLLVDVQISEVDINQVKAGQSVTLSFDAVIGQEYQGQVVEVALVGNVTQGMVSFPVTVELMDTDELVRPAMTAAVNIVINQLDDVLIVPNRAVRVVDGQRVVYVLRETESETTEKSPEQSMRAFFSGVPLGNIEKIVIVLGASSDLYSEVLEGLLQPGDEVILNPPMEVVQDGPPGFMMGPSR